MKLFIGILGLVVLVNGKALNQFEGDDDVTGTKDVPFGSRILGGLPAMKGQFPWQALLYMDYPETTLFGGGCLVSTTKILTAAHNWFDGAVTANKMRVFLGVDRADNLNDAIETSDVVIHENYSSAMARNDIAVVSLPKAVKFSEYVQPIALPFGPEIKEIFVGADATASGFGQTASGSYGSLNYSNLKVISNDQCIQEFGIIGLFVEPTNICTSGRGNTGVCAGDSGGPLVTYLNGKPTLIGISSFRLGGCFGDAPSAYTRVTSYQSFIESRL